MTKNQFCLRSVILLMNFFTCFTFDLIAAFNQVNISFYMLVITLSAKIFVANTRKKVVPLLYRSLFWKIWFSHSIRHQNYLSIFLLHINLLKNVDLWVRGKNLHKIVRQHIDRIYFVKFSEIFSANFLFYFFEHSWAAFVVNVLIDHIIFFKIQDMDSSSILVSAVCVKNIGTFKQLRDLSQEGTTNHPSKALSFVNLITTMLYGGKIRAVENEYMLLVFLHTQCKK